MSSFNNNLNLYLSVVVWQQHERSKSKDKGMHKMFTFSEIHCNDSQKLFNMNNI